MLYQFVVGDLNRPLGTGWQDDVSDDLLREDITACTHRDAAQRLPSAVELAERIESLGRRRMNRAALANVEATYVEAQHVAAERASRARAIQAIMVVVLICTIVIAIISFAYASHWSRRIESARYEAKLERDRAERAEATRQLKEQVAPIMAKHVARQVATEARQYLVRSDAALTDYSLALRLAEVAYQLESDNTEYWCIKGMAQYRLGRYQEARETLRASESAQFDRFFVSQPLNVVFLAMTNHQLGFTQEAHRLFERARDLMQRDPWQTDADSQAVLHEAEAMFASKESASP